jgi:hypothetical protein
VRAAAASLGSLVLAACASQYDAQAIAAAERAAILAHPDLAEALERMRGAVALGDEDRARSELAAIRAMPGAEGLTHYLDNCEAILEGRTLARSLERGSRIEPLREQVTLGDPVHVRLVLASDGVPGKSGKIEIPKETGGGLFSSRPRVASRLLTTLATTSYDPYGGEQHRLDTIPVTLRDDIVIPEGETYPMEFALEGFPENAVVARVFEVSADIFPAEVLFAGSRMLVTKIRCAPCTVVALPSGYEAFATQPLESLGSLLAQTGPAPERSLLACVWLLPREDKEAAKRLLAKYLVSAGSQRSLAIIAALRQLTGDRERGLDRAAWLGYASELLESSAQR